MLQIFGFSKSVLLQSFYRWTGPQNSFQHGSDQQKLRSLVWSFLNIKNITNRSNSDEDRAKTVRRGRICSICWLPQLWFPTFSKTESCSLPLEMIIFEGKSVQNTSRKLKIFACGAYWQKNLHNIDNLLQINGAEGAENFVDLDVKLWKRPPPCFSTFQNKGGGGGC